MNKTNKTWIYVLVLVVITSFLYVIHKRENQITTSGPIKIGASLSLTGVAADFGMEAKKAMELAVEEINAKGGMNGRKVELYIEDDQTDPKTAQSAYQKLVHIDNVDALVGGLFDFTAHPVLPNTVTDKITYISPINFVMPSFTMNEYSFVMYPEFDQVISELSSVIQSKHIKKLGMIRFESGFSESIRDTLKRIMEKEVSGGVFVEDTYKSIGSSDFRTNILKIKEASPDAVFLDMLDFDVVKYLNDSKNFGFNKTLIGYTSFRDVFNNPKVDISKLEGSIMLDWELPSEEFIKVFQSKYGTLPRKGSNKSYDAVYVLAEALANTKSREEVPAYLETHTFKTVNAEFSFTKKHAADKILVKVFEIKDGKMVEIKSNQK